MLLTCLVCMGVSFDLLTETNETSASSSAVQFTAPPRSQLAEHTNDHTNDHAPALSLDSQVLGQDSASIPNKGKRTCHIPICQRPLHSLCIDLIGVFF